MAGCTSPLYRVPFASKNFAVLSSVDQKRLHNHGVFLRFEQVQAYNGRPGWDPELVQRINCGQCINCRLMKSRDWAVRCMLEAERHEHNYFITLTYDDYNLPSGEFVDYNGDIWDSNLNKRDVQLFIKNYREWERTNNGNTGLKVFYCGEYGGETGRPHYHLCIFGCSEIPDLKFGFKKKRFTYYKSNLLEGFWSIKEFGGKTLRGFVDISELTFDTVAYTARYCLKKQQGLMKKDFLDVYETLLPELRPELRLQPFVQMSLKPGIAAEYWEENKGQIKSEDLVKYSKNFELFKAKPPRYFDKLFDREDPKGFSKVKKHRMKLGLSARKAKAVLFSESELERQRREENIAKIKEEKYYVRNL